MMKQKRLLILLPVLAIAAWLALFGDKSPSDGVAEPVAERSEEVGSAQSAEESEDDESVRPGEIIRLSSRQPIKIALSSPAVEVDLFASSRAVAAEAAQAEQSAAPPPPPPPPPQPTFNFIGKKYDDGRWTVFLEQGGQPLVAQQGSVIDGFRIDAIRDNEIQLTHVDTKSKHIIPTEGGK